jgi:hypothetical protein
MKKARYGSCPQEPYSHRVPMVPACTPSYSGSRNQENCGLKPAKANSSRDPISKNKKKTKQNKSQKGLVKWLKV